MVRQWLQQRCRYQLDSTVSNGLVHTGVAAAAVPQGVASSILCDSVFGSGCGKNPCEQAFIQ